MTRVRKKVEHVHFFSAYSHFFARYSLFFQHTPVILRYTRSLFQHTRVLIKLHKISIRLSFLQRFLWLSIIFAADTISESECFPNWNCLRI